MWCNGCPSILRCQAMLARRKVRRFGDHRVDTRVAVASESSVMVLEGAVPERTDDEITSVEVGRLRRA